MSDATEESFIGRDKLREQMRDVLRGSGLGQIANELLRLEAELDRERARAERAEAALAEARADGMNEERRLHSHPAEKALAECRAALAAAVANRDAARNMVIESQGNCADLMAELEAWRAADALLAEARAVQYDAQLGDTYYGLLRQHNEKCVEARRLRAESEREGR